MAQCKQVQLKDKLEWILVFKTLVSKGISRMAIIKTQNLIGLSVRRLSLAGIVLVAGATQSFAQSIFTNPITGTNPNTADPYTTGQTVAANMTASGIGRGAGITVSSTGTATYTVPATGSCTVLYQVCAPAPNATICDTATLTVTAGAADMSAALGAATPAVVSPGQIITGLTATCTNISGSTATNATCVPTVSAGTISALSCTPSSPQATLAAGGTIVCTYTYTAPGTAGGADEPTTAVTFTATTGATNDSVLTNNVATVTATVIDAVNDTAGQPGGSVGATTDVGDGHCGKEASRAHPRRATTPGQTLRRRWRLGGGGADSSGVA